MEKSRRLKMAQGRRSTRNVDGFVHSRWAQVTQRVYHLSNMSQGADPKWSTVLPPAWPQGPPENPRNSLYTHTGQVTTRLSPTYTHQTPSGVNISNASRIYNTYSTSHTWTLAL